jgi:hypothetical protein
MANAIRPKTGDRRSKPRMEAARSKRRLKNLPMMDDRLFCGESAFVVVLIELMVFVVVIPPNLDEQY